MRVSVWVRTLSLGVSIAVSLSSLGLVAMGCEPSASNVEQTASPTIPQVTATPPTVTPPKATTPPGNESSTANLYEEVNPSVVRITTTTVTRGRFRSQQSQGTGSGVIIDKDGDILTNYHVIAGAQQLDVTLFDGSSAGAQVVGTDPSDDLAVIKADFSGIDLSAANLGDSDQIRIGDTVIAIGNPFGLDGTVTEGIVSGVNRTIPQQQNSPLRDLLQTDAAINPGNSGGPLVNLSGEVIGINTALENPTGSNTFVGVGYTVPINTAKEFLPQMIEGKTVVHALLGTYGQTLTPGLAKNLGLSQTSGVYVLQVDPGTPAAAAGVVGSEPSNSEVAATSPGGDVIIGVDDKQVTSSDEMDDYIDAKQPGDTVSLHVVRGGKEIAISATLAEWPNSS
jgi:S1-C subfamily serine protease